MSAFRIMDGLVILSAVIGLIVVMTVDKRSPPFSPPSTEIVVVSE